MFPFSRAYEVLCIFCLFAETPDLSILKCHLHLENFPTAAWESFSGDPNTYGSFGVRDRASPGIVGTFLVVHMQATFLNLLSLDAGSPFSSAAGEPSGRILAANSTLTSVVWGSGCQLRADQTSPKSTPHGPETSALLSERRAPPLALGLKSPHATARASWGQLGAKTQDTEKQGKEGKWGSLL